MHEVVAPPCCRRYGLAAGKTSWAILWMRHRTASDTAKWRGRFLESTDVFTRLMLKHVSTASYSYKRDKYKRVYMKNEGS